MKVAIYCRVSTENQVGKDKYGIPVQKEDAVEYCKENNLEISDFYIDEGISGSKINRSELNRMLADAEHKKFEQIIVAKFDRLSCDMFISLWIEKEFLKNEIEIISVAEPYRGNDPMTVAFRQMIIMFAQLERGRITERLTGGRLHKAKKGKYSGGRPALGYVSDGVNKTIIPDLEEAKTVIRIFSLRSLGFSFNRIAHIINPEGFKTKEGKEFSAMQVKRVIDRKDLYEGVYSYAGIETKGEHIALLQ